MFGRQPNRGGYGRPRGRRNIKGMLLIGLLFGAFSLFKYYSNTQVNPITGEKQHVAISLDQEIAIGLQSAPQMAKQHGGLHPDQRAQAFVKEVGNRLINTTVVRNSGYKYDFHLLADNRVVNAFALPGGQVFITEALFSKLTSEDQLAGILGHEIGHVIHRHGAERMAKMDLTKGLTGAAVMASGDYSTQQFAQMVGNLINMKYGRDQELKSDDWGVRLMMESGYNPEAMIEVQDLLEKLSGNSKRPPEFQSTHPSPDNRREKIRASMKKYERKAS